MTSVPGRHSGEATPVLTAPVETAAPSAELRPRREQRRRTPHRERFRFDREHLIRLARTWWPPAVVVVLASFLRLFNLGHPGSLVFDETYYVKDAWTLMHLGYEASWPEGADTQWNAGDTGGFSTDPSFIVHPQFGKWIIAAGLAVFGAENPVGWRISTAIVGILLVVLTMAIAHRLFHSMIVTTIAGGLLAIDGNAIVMSRVALLDGSVALLVLLGAGAVLLDRSWADRRLELWLIARETAGKPTDWGPTLWWRPWLIAAAIAFGLASSVKWNGIYFLAIFAVYSIGADALARRRAGLSFWLTSALLKQGPASFVLMVPTAVIVYVGMWFGWFATSGGYYRTWVEDGNPGWEGALAWVPTWFQNWWHYQSTIYAYHVSENSPHSYQANPLTWLFLVRPTSMYYQGLTDGTAETITGIANPLIWWASTAAIGFLIWQFARHRDRGAAFLLVGLAAGYLPWLLYLNRTVFQFYTIVFEPFMIIGLALALSRLLGRRDDPQRGIGLAAVGLFLLVAAGLSVFWYPLWTGLPAPTWFINAHFWLPSWR